MAFGWDVWCGAALVDPRTNGIGVIPAIGDHQHAWPQQGQQRLRCPAVGRLAAGQKERPWAALFVAQGVELGGASTATDADRLRPFPPFPPAAQRCAFMLELSSSTSAGGPPLSVNG